MEGFFLTHTVCCIAISTR